MASAAPAPDLIPAALSLKLGSVSIVSNTRVYPPGDIDLEEASLPDETARDGTTVKHPYAIICAIAMVTAAGSMLNGLVTVELPVLASDLHLSPALIIWPASINALTCGCTLIIIGSICDVIGPRITYLSGTLLQAVFVAAAGVSQNGPQMLVFRGLSGIAMSLCLPSAVSIITSCFGGKRQSMAFACLGAGQPVGFAIGLVLGGALTQYVSWRLGFYIGAAIIGANVGLIVWAVPATDNETAPWSEKRHRILRDIDWVGSFIATSSLALSSFVFAQITGNSLSMKRPLNISCLVLSLALVPVFVAWVARQEKLGKPALIPNSLWLNPHFTVICIAVFFAWGSFNALETIFTLYFQNAQGLSPVQASLRFLPCAIVGAVLEILAGHLVHRVSASILVNGGLFLACIAPMLMLFAQKSSSYWSYSFLANVFSPVGVNCLFTVANLLTTASFPTKTQALAGGVFNTITQIGKSFGIAMTALVASSVTQHSRYSDKSDPSALMEGYHAAFWYCFSAVAVTLALTLIGLRGVGKVGN